MRGTITAAGITLRYKYYPDEDDFTLETGEVDGHPMPRIVLDNLEQGALKEHIWGMIVNDIRQWGEGSAA